MENYAKIHSKITRPKPLRMLNVALEQLLQERSESQKILSYRDKHSRNLSDMGSNSSTQKAIATYAPNCLLPLQLEKNNHSGRSSTMNRINS